MKYAVTYTLLLFSILFLNTCSKSPRKILLFSKTEGFRHSSIAAGQVSIQQLLAKEGILVDTTEDASYFTEDSLKQYAAVIFLNTTGDILDHIQQADFERYIQAGGGFVGIHSATDTEYHWPWYNKLVGAYFNGHPQIQDATLKVIKPNDQCCTHLSSTWSLSEEWYNFKSIHTDLEVLMEIDESTYEGGTNGQNHPMVWKHHYDGGRAFYTALGHKEETYSDPLFLMQLLAGIEFAIGDNIIDYKKSTTFRVPEENRFNKKVLDFNLDEPMELDELGDRGIIFVERKGLIKLYDYETEQVNILDSLEVYAKDEDGLLGIAVDPDFRKNNWIYLFYSPAGDESIQHVSRFTLVKNQLSDEIILLKIPVIRKCCHSGGSLEFDKNGLLYIGVGDNTNPFESSGYAPIDERPDRQLYDAQRSASNTNDLRGKILRIRPEADGSYSIPEGNLFPEGTPKTRPEIYTMGLRNPFRFSIDSKNDYIYWGDIGPDAGEKDSLRGPAGMGEFNQAKAPGYYGWPYSRGDNQMYWDYDFKEEKSGRQFKPFLILNKSPNNTGLEKLPPVQKSIIWYGYEESKLFPWLGAGGVNPMSGPIYHSSDFMKSENSFPEYFDNKWFIYEWMRDWIYIVHLDKEGDFIQADPFMAGTKFSHPMDMLFSKDGKLYILEYGQKWFSKNLDARLISISYNPGNRPPVANFQADTEAGAAPLVVNFSAEKSFDYDQDNLIYNWSINNKKIEANSTQLEHTFDEAGIYDIELTVSDPLGATAVSNKKIMVGNEPPKVDIKLNDLNTIFWKNKKVEYNILVSDKEDGNTLENTLDTSKVKVTLNYIPEGEDLMLASLGHQQNVVPRGLELIEASGCKACHSIMEEVAGPSYIDVAKRYGKSDKETLIRRIIKGSQGIWGERIMIANPQLKIADAEEIVKYILSLNPDQTNDAQLMPLQGEITFDQHKKDTDGGQYILMASYLDNGNPEVEGSSLSEVKKIIFQGPKIQLENTEGLDVELGIWEKDQRTLVGSIIDNKQIKLPSISFKNLSKIKLAAFFTKDYKYDGKIEIRLGSTKGKLLGEKTIRYFDKKDDGFEIYEFSLERIEGHDDLILLFKNTEDKKRYILNADWLELVYD